MTHNQPATINLPAPLTFTEALQALLDGKCLGIRPGQNTHYVELWRPGWQRSDWQLRWCGSGEQSIRTNQFQGEWHLVIIDHRTLTPAQS